MSDEYDVIIKNGLIVDGTNTPPHRAALGVKAGRITAIGDVKGDAVKTINAEGKVVSPGFIDVHNHVDLSIIYIPEAWSFLRQGITSFVGGHCGDSAGPYNEFIGEPWFYTDIYEDVRPSMGRNEWLIPKDDFNARHKELYGWEVNWDTMAGYFAKVEEKGLAPNMLPLVGHGDIRSFVMGEDYKRYATEDEVNQMKQHVKQAMLDGCCGLSVGRTYKPGNWAGYDEILACARVAAEYGGVYNSHSLRSLPRGDKPPEEAQPNWLYGVQEVIQIARDTGMSVQVSHLGNQFQVTPPGNSVMDMAAATATMAVIDEAVKEGVDINFDVIPHHETGGIFTSPYLLGAFNSYLKIAGSPEQLVEALKMKDLRETIKKQILAGEAWSINPKWMPDWAERKVIAECSDERFRGKSLKEIGELLDVPPIDSIFTVLEADPMSKMVTVNPGGESVKFEYFKHPRMMVGCDTFAVDDKEQCRHPVWMLPNQNAFGGFPFYLRRMVREEKLLSVEEAVRKITSQPAEKFGMKDRGVLRVGAMADITVWSLDAIRDNGNQIEPRRYPDGVEHVLVNGVPVVESNVHTGALPGKILYREGSQ